MASHAFALGMSIASPIPAAKTHAKTPSVEELDAMELPEYTYACNLPYLAAITPAGQHTPAEAYTPNDLHTAGIPNDLESSQPPTPARNAAISVIVPSWSYPQMNKWRVLACCLVYLGNGLNDSALGALIPYIESWYGIGYAIVSLVFVTNAIGFILAAVFADLLLGRLGRAKALITSEGFMIAGYIIIASPVPFWLVVVAYMILGFGNALNLAYNNVFCANLANSTVILGAAHGSYGIGGILGPIIATALVSHGIHWARFYLITIGLRLVCMCFVGWAFWSYENEEATQFSNSLREIASRQAANETGPHSKVKTLLKALHNRVTIVGALMIFAYQGGEVSESGWFISYLINYRKGDPAKVGYVTSGFWAGITVGRFVLTHFAQRVGEKVFVFGLGVGVIVFQVMAWQIPNAIGDSVTVALLGLLLGPIYPCAQTIFTRLLPGRIQTSAIGFISSAGSSGGAVVPFLTGALAQAVGTFVLHPVCIAFFTMMLVCWGALPGVVKRKA
ncbi:Hypothetical protein R9X50_00753400 [Acrodontium crateriforme]|uniref:Major facilitator superfamily (MFS) profile domain-containing protein n=1 Tax=Acrodontium crateriforme TaxID=150365 RepID=A0AAQ3R7S1_9PEZI|nr:Hypothetical protein R9X50_00753400 [Acrodontium crateriforme]